MKKSNKQLKDGLIDKRANQLFQIVDNASVSTSYKNLLKIEIEKGLILNKATLKHKIKKISKFGIINEDNKSKCNNQNYCKESKYKKYMKYEESNGYEKDKKIKKLKPINSDKNYRNGLNRQGSIFGVMMVDLLAREYEEEKIYDELNESLAKNMPNKTRHILNDALKKYPDNPIFLYYTALTLYRRKGFSYADEYISKAKCYAIRYELSDNFLNKCDRLINDNELRKKISLDKRRGWRGREPRYRYI